MDQKNQPPAKWDLLTEGKTQIVSMLLYTNIRRDVEHENIEYHMTPDNHARAAEYRHMYAHPELYQSNDYW